MRDHGQVSLLSLNGIFRGEVASRALWTIDGARGRRNSITILITVAAFPVASLLVALGHLIS